MASRPAPLKFEITSGDRTSVAQWLVESLSPVPTSDSSIDASWRQRRQVNRHEGRQLRDRHREYFSNAIRFEADALVAEAPKVALDVLSSKYGLSWIDVSRMLRISVPALRKWRRDENGASPENHRKLASLAGFCIAFDKAGAGEPAVWLNVPFDSGYTAAPRDVYSEESAPDLLEFAIEKGDYQELLNQSDPQWRDRYARTFVTERMSDGTPVMVTQKSLDAGG